MAMWSGQIHGQQDLIRVIDTSCEEICDGSAELITFRYLPERYFYWMSESDGKYHPMNEAVLEELCPGQYRIRKVDVQMDEIPIGEFQDTTLMGFEGISRFVFSSTGRKELSLYMRLDREINHLNYYLKAEYSIDGGVTWSSSQQFHQKVMEDAAGRKHIYYMLNFPRSAHDQEEIIVKIYQRKTEQLSGQPQFQVLRSFIESKEYEEYAFEVGIKHHIRIQSTVSNELEGGDGYISLALRGGTPPYQCEWDDGTEGLKRTHLQRGTYSVKVRDRKNCQETARFVVLPPEGEESLGRFALDAREDLIGTFRLQIKDLYRKPLELIITSLDSTMVKKFEINPLYEDLTMDLDLSFLNTGEYQATLSTSGFSKNVAIRID
ncbi:MAG: hypothetical protein HKN79_11055 [Flavobacteriales bacterium]|nr:hypothetical protein [Flavobacteriales bacterium]